MALTFPDDTREIVLGTGAGAFSLLVGLVFLGVTVSGEIELLERTVPIAVLVVLALGYGVGGLYDIVAVGVPKRGAADLTVGAGIVLALLAPYGTSWGLFVTTAALVLVLAGLYHFALAADVFESTEELADELEG